MVDDLHTEAQADELRAFALLLTPDSDLGLSRGEGALHIALAVLAQEAIEDVYADCGDTDAGVLATNVGQRIARHLAKTLASRPHPSRTEASDDEHQALFRAVKWKLDSLGIAHGFGVQAEYADQIAYAVEEAGFRSAAPRERTEAEGKE